MDGLMGGRLLLGLLALAACSPGEGVVEVSVWGEDEVVEGLQLDDGWSVTFDHWVLAVRDVELADAKTEERIGIDKTSFVVDLTQHTEPLQLTTIAGPAERVVFGFTVAGPTGSDDVVDDVAGLAQEMAANGWAHHLAGTATDGSRTVAFDWGLDLPSRYTNCSNGEDGTDGLAIAPDGAAQAVLTVHPDHAFWSALGTEEAAIAFQAIADSDGGDGLVDNADLAAVATLDIGYETSGLVDNLYDFIAFSLAQSIHLNGDGLCQVRSL